MELTNQFEHIFFCGDLNYRIDMDRDHVLQLIQQSDYATLLEQDQLLNQKKLGNVFVGWKEAPITFPPTYRYNRGDRTYSDEVFVMSYLQPILL